MDYLSFDLGDEQYGIEITRVREIREMERVTRLVEAPAHVKGVINLRGQIVVVTDLRTRFGMPAAEGSKGVMIVIDGESMIGMVVDSVSDVLALDPSDISLPASLEGVVDERFVQGIATREGRMLIVLDVVPLLTLPAAGETLQ